MNSPLITFIIPTIGRISLIHTIQSLQKQKMDLWKCIILFDGIQNIHFQHFRKDPRISILEIPKTGENISGSRAGLVRNIGFSFVQTPWIGFVDDDDTLSPYYINHLIEEIEKEKEIDVILFRMIYKNKVYLPPLGVNEIKKGEVGISFTFKTKLILEDPTLTFQNHPFEDFLFLQSILQKQHPILISSHISYYVKSQYFYFHDPLLTSNIIQTLPIQPKYHKRLFILLQGGLGNLLFQICAGLHFGQMENRDVFFIYRKNKNHLRKSVNQYKIFESLLPSFITNEEWEMIPKRSISSFQESNPFDTNDLFSFLEKNRESEMIYLKGYFQHISIFESTLSQWISLFSFSFSPSIEISNRTIAIHIRVGDYIKYPEIYLILPNSYYENALKQVDYHSQTDQLILFTDDLPYLQKNYSFIHKYPILYANDLCVDYWKEKGYQQDEIEIFMMSQCDILISANSTFSLWAGYFSKLNTKIYIPSQYFSNENAYIPMSHFLHSQKDYTTISLD